MLPHILRALRILASARFPGEARIAPAIRGNPEYLRGQAKALTAGASGGVGAGAAMMGLGQQGVDQGYLASITPDEAAALGLRGESDLSNFRLTPEQMDKLALYQEVTRQQPSRFDRTDYMLDFLRNSGGNR